jgi:hypothetical protein
MSSSCAIKRSETGKQMIDKPHPSFGNDDSSIGTRIQAIHSTSKHGTRAVVRPPSECRIPIEADNARTRMLDICGALRRRELGRLLLRRRSADEGTR